MSTMSLTSNPVESTIQQQEQDPPSSSLRRSSRSNKFSGPYYYSVHPPPPLDPEMMRVWFPHPDTLKHVDIKKIRRSGIPNAGFSAKTLATNAAKHAPMVPASIIQKIRQQDALLFTTWYKYDETIDDMKDKKTRICSAGGCQSWTEQSSGIPWVTVHGVDQIYVVVGRSCLPSSGFGLNVLTCFKHEVVAEMEAVESHQLIDQSLKKGPFAGSSSKVSLTASDAEQCIKFLVDKLQDASDFS